MDLQLMQSNYIMLLNNVLKVAYGTARVVVKVGEVSYPYAVKGTKAVTKFTMNEIDLAKKEVVTQNAKTKEAWSKAANACAAANQDFMSLFQASLDAEPQSQPELVVAL